MNVSQQSAATRSLAGPTAPSLRVDFVDRPSALRFAFVAGVVDAQPVRCAHLAGPPEPERWQLGADFRVQAQAVTEVDGDIETAARRAYVAVLAAVRASAQPHLVRIWNYLGAINDGAGDNERYRRFCVGRAAAADAAFNAEPPAATAIGHDGGAGVLQVVALCAATPAIALENPRQTPAWSYPREYGPVSPGFSRGALLDAGSHAPTLLASGTASIVGHVSQHVGDVAEQLRESLRNLDALLTVGSQRAGIGFHFERCQALRVYLRHAHDLALAQAVLAHSGLPPERIVYLRGDVCRRELDVEIEGVFGAG